jgi:integrase
MAERRQLPPQIKRVELAARDGGRPVVRYQLIVDVGVVDGRRKQLRKRYKTEREARAALDAVRGDVAKGTYVHPSEITLAQACEDWLASKHGLKPSTLHGHRVNLAPALAELGEVAVQKLSKRHIDDLVTALRAGGLASPTGKSRKSWSPRSVNYMLGLLMSVLRDQMRQGHVVRNVAELVDRIPADPKPSRHIRPIRAPSGSRSYRRRPIRDRMAACAYRATPRRSGRPRVERHRPDGADAADLVDAAPVW